jgi:hypothetical protein
MLPKTKADPMAGLEFEMTYRLRVRGPMPATQGSPVGEHIYWEMSEGTLEGPRIKARIAMPGGDWYGRARMALAGPMSASNSSQMTARLFCCTTPALCR